MMVSFLHEDTVTTCFLNVFLFGEKSYCLETLVFGASVKRWFEMTLNYQRMIGCTQVCKSIIKKIGSSNLSREIITILMES